MVKVFLTLAFVACVLFQISVAEDTWSEETSEEFSEQSSSSFSETSVQTTSETDDGNCDQEPPKFNCTKANEVYEECPSRCPYRTCGIDDRLVLCPPPKPEEKPSCEPQCRCKPGYFRDAKGNCVLWEQCDTKCPRPNEIYDPCDTSCPARRCDFDGRLVRCKAPPEVGDKECLIGCRCKDGYKRDKRGVCIPEAQCPQKCEANAFWDPCPDCNPQTCATVGQKFNCPFIPANNTDPRCKGACRCQKGYARDNNGDCVPVEYCSKCTGPNQVYDLCPGCSPQTCETKDNVYHCPMIKCKPACRCKRGFFKNVNGECVSSEDCDKCKGPHEFWSCGSACDNRCDSKYGQDNCNIQNIVCNQKCYCQKGYARATNGTCIPKADCQYECPVNERYEKCPAALCTPKKCSDAGFPSPCELREEGAPCPGKPGCVCNDGYLRNEKGVCVPTIECPSCGGDKNATVGCGVNCGRLCSNYKKKDVACILICYPDACDCKPGFVFDSNTQKCVLPKHCTPECKKNEVYSNCINGGCQKKKCTDLTKPDICVHPKTCEGGCLCAPGFLRAKNGTCVPTEKCDAPLPQCKPNEEFSACGRDGCLKYYCSDLDLPPLCRDTFTCTPKCECKEGFLRASFTNDKCVPVDECPRKCGKNEEYSDCPALACSPQTCAQVNDPPSCPDYQEKCPGEPGCICSYGFLRNSEGKCIPKEECPNQKCPKNEVLVPCPQALCAPKTCAQAGKPIPCPRFKECPGKPGCVCAEGYLRNAAGVCIPKQKCPSCGGDSNARPGCGGYCGRRCSDRNATEPIACTAICDLNGCDCRPGYWFDNTTNKCVKPEQCAQDSPCPENEQFEQCPDAMCQPETCKEAGFPVKCALPGPDGQCPGKPRCVCKGGYLRNNDGLCVPKEQCPSCGGDSNAVPGCGGNCGRHCSDLGKNETTFCPLICNLNGCDCRYLFVFDDDKKQCVLPEQCPPRPCGKNEEYSGCSNGLCRVQSCSDKGKFRPCPPMAPGSCIPGCVCPEKFLRNKNGTCVPEDQCEEPPTTPTCPANEQYVQCPETMCQPETCKEAGFPVACPMPGPDGQCPGKPRCICNGGYLRNSEGICIPKKQCPSCGGDDNAIPGCGVNCGRHCSNYNSTEKQFCPLFCNTNGCDCKSKYVYDNNINKCVLPEKCTPICKVNEQFSDCSNAVCRHKNCDDVGKPIACPAVASCEPGCLCIDKYLRAANGTCVPEEQCNNECPTCPEGEVYNKCPPPQCDAEYCPKTRNDPQTCPFPYDNPSNCGKPRCVCGFNSHRDRTTGKCIPTRKCPPFKCDGPNEIFNDCVPVCPGENCTDYLNNATCPKYRIGIVVPCKLGCRCKEGYYRDSRNICVPGPDCKKCPEGETFNTCPPPPCDGEYCPRTRDDPQTCPYPDNNASNCGTPRCVCNFNSHRDRDTGKCIATRSCPPFKCDGPNEKFNDCVPVCPGETCTDYLNNATCPKYKIGIVVPCKLGCRCNEGFYRDTRNVCIPGSDCKKSGGSDESCDAEKQKQALEKGNLDLNWVFIYELAKLFPGDSLFTSVFSLLTPLAQLTMFSKGRTFSQLASAINVQNKSDITCGFPALLDSITAAEGTILDLAAKIYVYKNGQISKALEDASENVFRAKAESVDFNKAEEASKTINQWVSDATRGKITDLVAPDMFDDSTRLVLANAIYFKGLWKYTFNKNNTKPRDFYVSSGKTIQVPMMTQKTRVNYAELSDPDIQAIELPYKDENLSFVAILPKQKDGLMSLLEKMKDASVFQKIINSFSKQQVTMYLPRIDDLKTTIDLKKILREIGVTDVFDSAKAELSGMTIPDENLYVSTAIQKCTLTVNEDGSEASAANAFGVVALTSVRETRETIFDADHPYAYCINHRGRPLFCGTFCG